MQSLHALYYIQDGVDGAIHTVHYIWQMGNTYIALTMHLYLQAFLLYTVYTSIIGDNAITLRLNSEINNCYACKHLNAQQNTDAFSTLYTQCQLVE